MDLYVCKERTEEYSCGMIVVAANSLEQAKEMVKTSRWHQPDWGYRWDLEYTKLMERCSIDCLEPQIVEEVYRGE